MSPAIEPASSATAPAGLHPTFTSLALAHLFQVDVQTIRRWSACGRIPPGRKVGGWGLRWTLSDIEPLIGDRREGV
jgi:predicted DNA-binding transcriptional regulator AlpA